MFPILYFITKIGICLLFFTVLVNCKDTPHLKSITINYFERGHTFMPGDTYHHLVKKAMEEIKNVCDYKDFVKALEQDVQAT